MGAYYAFLSLAGSQLPGVCITYSCLVPCHAQQLSYILLQYVGLQNLVQRNKQLYGSGNAPSGGVALPFILVQVELSGFLVKFSCMHFTIKATEIGAWN